MSEYINNRADEHVVKHLFSGKNHFFEVKSSSGEKYTVQVKMSCECPFMSREGIANGKMCSHILAVLKKIVRGEWVDSGKEE